MRVPFFRSLKGQCEIEGVSNSNSLHITDGGGGGGLGSYGPIPNGINRR